MGDNEASILTIFPDARDTLSHMYNRVRELGSWFGPDSKEYLDASGSLANIMANVVHWRECKLSKDFAPLSLAGFGDGIQFGLIFHPTRRGCTAHKCSAVINDDGKAWSYMSSDYVCFDGQHVPSYPLDCPTPGTWSFHS